jgi:hypothetical protein
VREGEKHGRKMYFSLCNGEWLKVIWILGFFLGVRSTYSVIKEGRIVLIKFI